MKYYIVSQCAEGETMGIVALTPEEVELIDRVTNPNNWEYCYRESYSGSFRIRTKPVTMQEFAYIRKHPDYIQDVFYGNVDWDAEERQPIFP